MRSNGLLLGLMAVSALSIASCKKDVDGPSLPGSGTAKLHVQDVTLGNSVGADKKVVDEKDSFHPNDTIYVSVETTGTAPEATVTARWKYENGTLVNESTQRIIPAGAVATEFHLQKPDGFPTGEYKVEILLNGEKVEEKDFEVEVGT